MNRDTKKGIFVLVIAGMFFGYKLIIDTELYQKNFEPITYWEKQVESELSNVEYAKHMVTISAIELQKFNISRKQEFTIRYLDQKFFFPDENGLDERVNKELDEEFDFLKFTYDENQKNLIESEKALLAAKRKLKKSKS